MNGDSQLTVSQLVQAVLRHKFKTLVTFVVIMALVVAAYIMMPRKYGSEGRLFIQMGRNNSGLDPTPGNSSVSIQDTRETEIRSVVEIIKSRAVLEAVVDLPIDPVTKQIVAETTAIDKNFRDVGMTSSEETLQADVFRYTIADEILKSASLIPSFSIPKFGSSSGGAEMTGEEYDDARKCEQAVEHLQDNLSVFSEKKTSVIAIYLKTRTAKLAQTIVNQIMEVARKKHLEVHQVKGSTDFFKAEFDIHEDKLSLAIMALSDFRSQNDFLSIEDARRTHQNLIDKLEVEILDGEALVDSSRGRLNKIASELDSITEKIMVPTTGVERAGYDESYSEYFRLKAERERLAGTFNNHPRLKAMDKQLAELEKDLDGMQKDRTEEQMVLNPVYEQVKISHVDATSTYEAAVAKLKLLNSKSTAAIARLKKLNELQEIADQKQRNVDVARQYLSLYTQKFGESKIMEALDDKDISDVVVAQNASLLVKHVSPKASLILPLGFGFAMFVSLLAAMFFDRKNSGQSYQEEEIEQLLELPVLVTLPRVPSSRNMVS